MQWWSTGKKGCWIHGLCWSVPNCPSSFATQSKQKDFVYRSFKGIIYNISMNIYSNTCTVHNISYIYMILYDIFIHTIYIIWIACHSTSHSSACLSWYNSARSLSNMGTRSMPWTRQSRRSLFHFEGEGMALYAHLVYYDVYIYHLYDYFVVMI